MLLLGVPRRAALCSARRNSDPHAGEIGEAEKAAVLAGAKGEKERRREGLREAGRDRESQKERASSFLIKSVCGCIFGALQGRARRGVDCHQKIKGHGMQEANVCFH